MKSIALFIALAALPQEVEPGLVAEYFELSSKPESFPAIPAGQTPTLVRLEPTVNHALVEGDFHGTKLTENFFARWTGLLRCDQEGLYNFYVESDDGCRLYLDSDLILDNSAGRAMEQRADRVVLKAGDHVIRFEYFQASGAAGVNLQWRTPTKGRSIIPSNALFHRKGTENIEWNRDQWEKRPPAPPTQPVAAPKQGRYAAIDFGPFLTRTLGPAKAPVALAGHLLRIAPDATVCFDPQLLRVAATWTGPFLNFPTEKDGLEGFPTIAGTLRFTNPVSPGWGDPKDPRPLPYGPLPRERGHWRGLYTYGKKAILSYTVGKAEILELHGFENGSFTRTIRVSKADSPLTVLLAPSSVDAGLIGEGAILLKQDNRLELKITQPGTFKVSIPPTAVSPAENLEALTKGGPAQWTEPVVTKGMLGNEPGAYQVDTLTLPYENPWNSYLRLVALDFLPDGRAVVATVDGDVWIASSIDQNLENISWKRFATGLYQPLGLRVVNGSIYTLGRDQITRLIDLNGDGEADFYENFNNDCMLGPNSGEWAMDLQVDSGGSFYYTKAGATGYKAATPHNGCVLKVSKDGSTLEVVAVGFRAAMGLCVGPDGFMTATDQQGNYMAECPIVRVRKGGFYGFVLDHHPETKTMARETAICWLPMDMDNSSGGQVWVPDDRWGPLKGRLIHTSYGQSRLLLALLVEDRSQGGVTRFPLTFASGIMRPQFNPLDGQLYVAGLRGWQTTAVKDGCLQRVRYTGKPLLMPMRLNIRKSGIDLGFSEALDPETAGDIDRYSAQWFHVESTPDYGSPEFNATDHTRRGRENVPITAVKLREDGKTIAMEIDGLRPVTNLILKFSILSVGGRKIQNEVALTINHLPEK